MSSATKAQTQKAMRGEGNELQLAKERKATRALELMVHFQFEALGVA